MICVEKIALHKNRNRFHGEFITEELITNTNNSTNIRKNTKLFLDVLIRTRRSCLKEKTGDEKSRDCSFKCLIINGHKPVNMIPIF